MVNTILDSKSIQTVTFVHVVYLKERLFNRLKKRMYNKKPVAKKRSPKIKKDARSHTHKGLSFFMNDGKKTEKVNDEPETISSDERPVAVPSSSSISVSSQGESEGKDTNKSIWQLVDGGF